MFLHLCIILFTGVGGGVASQHASQVTRPGRSASRGGGWADPPTLDTWDTLEYGQQAGGMHLTGMHSC